MEWASEILRIKKCRVLEFGANIIECFRIQTDFPIITVTIHLVNISRTLAISTNQYLVNVTCTKTCFSSTSSVISGRNHINLCDYSMLSPRSFALYSPWSLHQTNHFSDYNCHLKSDGSLHISQIYKPLVPYFYISKADF